MLFFKRTLRSLAALFVLLLGMFVSVNLADEQLSPNVTQLLQERPAPSAEALMGFQYLLGFRVAAGEDPASWGQKFYERRIQNLAPLTSEEKATEMVLQWSDWRQPCGPVPYCAHEARDAQRQQIDMDLSENLILLSRLETLIDYGAVAGDVSPGLDMTGGLSFVLSGTKWLLLRLSLFIHDGRSREAWEQILKLQNFFRESLIHTTSAMDALILTTILESLREFASEAALEKPEFRQIVEAEKSDPFEIKITFADLENQIARGEVAMAQRNFNRPFNWARLNLSETESEGSLASGLIDLAAPLLFKPNKTINLFAESLDQQMNHPCVQTAEPCPLKVFQTPWSGYLVNPLGHFIIESTQFEVSRFQKLRMKLDKLKEPFVIPSDEAEATPPEE